MALYEKYYRKIAIFRYNFEKILSALEKESDFKKKLRLALCGANYFVYNNSGYFTSSVLENFFIGFAKKIKVPLEDIVYSKNSILHVMSEGYQTGGHTRVVERWIENAPSDQKHSVVFTRKNLSELKILKENVKKRMGEYISLNEQKSLTNKAADLRKLAMQYEYIILHTHQDDPVPILAFGVSEFTRPVYFYNHASHTAWLGKSIADVVLDINKNDEVTTLKRGITDTYFLGVPSKNILLTTADKTEARKKLNIPLHKKIIVTSGAESRFTTICGHSFCDYLKDIMDKDTYCYVIGVPPSPSSADWIQLKKETNGHVVTLGFIDFDKGFLEYLKAADLYLDSYPLCGGTATIDAVSCGIPVISLKSVYPHFDYLTETSAHCQTEEEFISKAKKALHDKEYANKIFEEVKASLVKYQSPDAWNKRIANLFATAPKTHKIRELSPDQDYAEDNDLSVLCNATRDKNFLKRNYKLFLDSDVQDIAVYGNLYKIREIPLLLQICTYKTHSIKTKIFKVFNIKIFKYRKKI